MGKSVKSAKKKKTSEADEDFDPNKEYIVEKIISSKFEKETRFLRIKWLNYGSEFNTWEPAENIPEQLIEEFDANLPPTKKQKLIEKKPSISGEAKTFAGVKANRYTILDKLEVGKTPKEVYGIFNDGKRKIVPSELSYVIKYDDGGYAVFDCKLAHSAVPLLLIDFFENNMIWKMPKNTSPSIDSGLDSDETQNK